jgi:hypothetical protein
VQTERGNGYDGRDGGTYFEHAIGNSQLPGTDWTTMFASFTPEARSDFLVPARRGSIIASDLCVSGVQLQVYFNGVLTGVPASMDNANTEGTAIEPLSFSWSFECCHLEADSVIYLFVVIVKRVN